MFCGKCGASLPEDAVKCDKCGAPVRIRSAAAKNRKKDRNQSRREPSRKEMPAQEPFPKEVPAKEMPVVEKPVRSDSGITMESYLASLPLRERIRRKIAETGHRLAETADEKNMRSHMERAAKYYGVPLDEDVPPQQFSTGAAGRKSAPVGKTPAAEERQERTIPAENTGKAAAEKKQAEKVSTEKTGTPAAEKQQEKKAPAEKAENVSVESSREEKKPVEETAHVELAEQVTRERSEKGRARLTDAERHAEPEQEKPVPEKAAAAEEGDSVTEKKKTGSEMFSPASEADLLSPEERADRMGGKQESAAQTAEKGSGDAAGEKAGGSARAEVHPSAAEEDAAAAREAAIREREAYERARRAREAQGAAAVQLTREQLQAEEARLIQRYQEDAPDQMDQTLGRYGLTKDAAVKLATLFLIAVLSIIYVMGRSRQPSIPEDVPVAGEGMTGAPAYTEPGTEDGQMEESPEGGEVPTGGGDF